MSKWKLCKECYPTIMGAYIISGRMKYTWEKEYTYFVDVAEYMPSDDWWTFNDWDEGQDEYEIMAWQELPEPYKEEQK